MRNPNQNTPSYDTTLPATDAPCPDYTISNTALQQTVIGSDCSGADKTDIDTALQQIVIGSDCSGADKTDTGNQFDLQEIAEALHTSAEEIVMTAGLDECVLQDQTKAQSNMVQERLCDMMAVLNKVAPRFDSLLMAYAWYRSETIPRFGGCTVEQLVRKGKTHRILEYIDAIDAGVYA